MSKLKNIQNQILLEFSSETIKNNNGQVVAKVYGNKLCSVSGQELVEVTPSNSVRIMNLSIKDSCEVVNDINQHIASIESFDKRERAFLLVSYILFICTAP